MIKISGVIITYNEERNIGRCLASVKDIADDIVVVDSFSSDNTKSICESYGARVIEHAFEGHIKQKNFAITQAKYPHQLSLDADEALTEELTKEILKVNKLPILHTNKGNPAIALYEKLGYQITRDMNWWLYSKR